MASKGDPYKPFRDLVALQDRMSRLFEETIRQRQDEKVDVDETGWAPAVDIYEMNQELVITLELPGAEQESVDIRVENNVLSVRGERDLPPGIPRDSFHRIERPYGRFSRDFTLPAGVNVEGIAASFDEGLLVIRVPRKKTAKSRKIEIGQ